MTPISLLSVRMSTPPSFSYTTMWPPLLLPLLWDQRTQHIRSSSEYRCHNACFCIVCGLSSLVLVTASRHITSISGSHVYQIPVPYCHESRRL